MSDWWLTKTYEIWIIDGRKYHLRIDFDLARIEIGVELFYGSVALRIFPCIAVNFGWANDCDS